MSKQPYQDHCPDCIPLPTSFPTSCLGPLLNALRGQIDDPKCVVHCGLTVLSFGAGLWINSADDHPPVGSVFTASQDYTDSAENRKAAATDLEKLAEACKSYSGKSAEPSPMKALPWLLIANAIWALIQQLLKDKAG